MKIEIEIESCLISIRDDEIDTVFETMEEYHVSGQTEDGNVFTGTGLSVMAAMAEAGMSLQMIMEEANNGEV